MIVLYFSVVYKEVIILLDMNNISGDEYGNQVIGTRTNYKS